MTAHSSNLNIFKLCILFIHTSFSVPFPWFCRYQINHNLHSSTSRWQHKSVSFDETQALHYLFLTKTSCFAATAVKSASLVKYKREKLFVLSELNNFLVSNVFCKDKSVKATCIPHICCPFYFYFFLYICCNLITAYFVLFGHPYFKTFMLFRRWVLWFFTFINFIHWYILNPFKMFSFFIFQKLLLQTCSIFVFLCYLELLAFYCF